MTLSATNLLQVANLLQATNHVQETNELLSGNQQTQPTPSFSPTGFPFSLPSRDVVMVTITSAGADHIYYTADGSAPTPSSTEYSGPVTVDVSLTLKAIATRVRVQQFRRWCLGVRADRAGSRIRASRWNVHRNTDGDHHSG